MLHHTFHFQDLIIWQIIKHSYVNGLNLNKRTTSPIRPTACESEDIMLIAPMSCKISSAAIVCSLSLEHAKAKSSGISLFSLWHTICMSQKSKLRTKGQAQYTSLLPGLHLTNMSRCSSIVLCVKGRVVFVDEGRTFFIPHTLMISGA